MITIEQRSCRGNIINDSSNEYPDVIKRILSARGVDSGDELSYSLKDLIPVSQLGSVRAAAELLADEIQQQHTILIIGDYDADGATATALVIRALNLMGFYSVDYLVPDRVTLGYGLTPEIVELAHRYEPHCLMTVDNGVSSDEGVRAAQQAGYKVLITDHHLQGKVLPEPDVMVNPNLANESFPSKALAGVGVAFYVMLALKQVLKERNYFIHIQEPNLTSLLDLVAMGTVADLVPLDRNNRILVEQGIRRIRAGHVSPGIKALFEVSGRDSNKAKTSDFAFACAPRLNAAGRLADMSRGIQCLLAEHASEAALLAKELNELNIERKRIESEMKEEAQTILDTLIFDTHSSKATLPPIICLHQEDWHEGVIGILASRIKERYYRPAIIFASNEQGQVKGSARSIEGIHMRDAIERVATQNPGLIQRFGGHAMAAGLTLAEQDLAQFEVAITRVVAESVQKDTFKEVIYTDGELSDDDFNQSLAKHIQQVAPWGQTFPEPTFEGDFTIKSKRILKDLHLKTELQLAGSSKEALSAIMFFADLDKWPKEGEQVRLVYTMDINEFRGASSLQLLIRHVCD